MADKDDKKDGPADVAPVRADATTGGATLDQVLATMNTILTRVGDLGTSVSGVIARVDSMEANEKARCDAEEKAKQEAEEKARADAAAADADKDEKKADADDKAEAKADAISAEALAGIRKDIESVASRIPLQVSDKDYAAMADAQAKADRVYQAFGDAAPRPLVGETLLAYRRRLATGLKTHSKTWGQVDLLAIADAVAFDVAETQIYADAMHAAHNPTDLPEGELRAIVSVDSTGRRITQFAGRPSAWMSSFSANRRRLVGIGRKE